MADTTVIQLAKQLNKDPNILLKSLNSYGVKKSNVNDALTEAEMKSLLSKINAKTSSTRKRVTKTVKLDGKHQINVSVKKKRRVAPKSNIERADSNITDNRQRNNQDSNKQNFNRNKNNNFNNRNHQQKPVVTNSNNANSVNSTVNTVKPVVAPIKSSGFVITEMPKQVTQPKQEKQVEEKELANKKKKAPKRFTDNVVTNTKSKREKEQEEGRKRNNKGTNKSFRKASPKQLSQLANDVDSFDDFGKRRGKNLRNAKVKKQEFTKPVENETKTVTIYEGITVSDLAQKLAVKAAEIIKILFNMGVMTTINQSLDQDTAVLIIEEMGHKYIFHKEDVLEEKVTTVDRSIHKKITRAPVVTIMGHVDHGKTSLLDYIREAKVVDGEAGGITQHIGAYSVKASHGGNITFLDTPGHEAFTSMRARGAKSTDIVILVVAADDGVMPQTVEAIQHAKAAKVPIIVAVNKMDKPEADPERVISELAQRDVIPESWGGDVMFVNVSAKTGQGIDELLDGIILQSEVLELEAFGEGDAEGVVIESRLEKGRGPVATILIQNGVLNQGDIVLCGTESGRVRAMNNDHAQKIKTAGPSTPVEILGLSGVPNAGDKVIVVQNEKKAKEVAELRMQKQKEAKIAQEQSLKLSNMFSSMKEGEQQSLRVIIKGDVQGSVEAIKESLIKLSTEEVKVDIVATGIGGITSSDVTLAVASTAVIVGFNVRADGAAKKIADKDGVELRYYNIIYDLIDDVKKAMSGLLSPEMREQIIGIAQVREVYRSSKFGSIAGCMVIEGSVKKSNPIRVLRDQVVIYEGSLESLKRFKDDASEVKKGLECGIGVKNYNDVRAGDQIEVFEIIEVAKEL